MNELQPAMGVRNLASRGRGEEKAGGRVPHLTARNIARTRLAQLLLTGFAAELESDLSVKHSGQD